MKVLVCFLAATLLAATSAQAALITLDFDELAAGTILDTEYAGLGVTFANSAGNLLVSSVVPGAPFTPPSSVLPANFNTVGNFNQATFSIPVSFVSVVMGDLGADADALTLQLFDAADNLIGSDGALLGAGVAGGLVLSASAPNIAYARFFGVGVNNNSVFFDNFAFETGTVPEPAALILLGTALAFGARRHRLRIRR